MHAAHVYALAPLEYRVALDAAVVWCSSSAHGRVICQSEALYPEVTQRIDVNLPPPWGSMVWLEPQTEDWTGIIKTSIQGGKSISRLAAILSLPPARYLPEKPESQSPLGYLRGGIHRLCKELEQAGLAKQAIFGLHSGQSVGLNYLANASRQMGLPALGDRFEFYAKKHYTKSLQKAWGATCALVLAAKV